ncbi:MAG: DNA mismatch repair protein MutS, partial [Bacilli bacterium]
RDVIQIITPGANLDLISPENNFTGSLSLFGNMAILTYSDISTGEMYCLNLEPTREKILEEILSLSIRELVVSTDIDANIVLYLKQNSMVCLSYYNDCSTSIETDALFGNLKDDRQIVTSARLYNYLKNMEKRDLTYFKPVRNLMGFKEMAVDYSAQANMELVKSLDGKTFGTLYWLLNQTQTPMGARYLKAQILKPSADEEEINRRLNLTDCFLRHYLERENLRKDLGTCFDMERLIARMGYENCNGHDLLQLKKSLQLLPQIQKDLGTIKDCKELSYLSRNIGSYPELTDTLERAISEDCPLTITEGGIFKEGYSKELDELIELTSNDRKWISDLEVREKERTGIHNLKIGFNTVFGYYIEISAGQADMVKPEFGYIRKQTIKTAERYITPELKEKEDLILRARENRMSIEYRLFKELRKEISKYTEPIQKTSDALAQLDYFLDLAFVSSENRYVRPVFSNDRTIDVAEARHPILEKAAPEVPFVSNDYHMGRDTDVLIITGPNMGGKSTYMKEFGLLVLMAQIGCFVSAKSATLPVFDALYTRIGASDNLIKGQSTFMTEMKDVSEGLEDATEHSLFLFDEIGRGTATFDGMAIAQSIIEYIVKHVHAKTFFSTHYHEITKLSEKISGVKNIHCDVSEEGGKVTFLYKMLPGQMDRSYGVNVARLAGLPQEITDRAEELLVSLENQKTISQGVIKEIKPEEKKKDPLREELSALDPMTLSPLEALNYLIALKKKAK